MWLEQKKLLANNYFWFSTYLDEYTNKLPKTKEFPLTYMEIWNFYTIHFEQTGEHGNLPEGQLVDMV